MNLMGNKDTDTGKTLASLVIIARAVNHIYSTGKNVMLITPSSGNKAGALRDAVLKAIEVGLVKKDQLRIVTIIPHSSIEKTRSSKLFTDKELNRLNPVFVSDQGEAQDVKNIASDFFKRNKDLYDKERNTTLWYSLGIDNYKVADAMRACIEADFFCNELSSPDRYRYLHIHSVSSAYGLLGHNEGVKRFNKKKYLDIGYLLVQHLYTNDMVTSLLNHLGRDSKPQYKKSPDGIYVQEGNPNFPTSTSSLDQCIDTTFYSKKPPTCEEMNLLIEEKGGNGIVVSREECIKWLHVTRKILAPVEIEIPFEIDLIKEWSLIMAVTGALLSVERKIVTEFDVLVIHASGVYFQDKYTCLELSEVKTANTAEELESFIGG